jgi:holliday junction DNA helicase RuvA
MIGHLEGKVLETNHEKVIVDISGVGYIVFATPDTLSKVSKSKKVSLWTHLAVRENALDLYGFLEKEELKLFEMLLSVSGIGPKSALGILSIASVETLKSAVSEDNSSYLTKVSGIGSKTAQKIVLELKDKIGVSGEGMALKGEEDTLEALVAMGYTLSEARDALKEVPREIEGSNERLREALKSLGGNGS